MKTELLRPFDIAAAKTGEPLLYLDEREELFFHVIGPNQLGEVVVEGGSTGYVVASTPYALHMAPLCWVEGKPVYKGDTLYRFSDHKGKVRGFDGEFILVEGEDDGYGWLPSCCTWAPPKVKKTGWINIYPSQHCIVHSTALEASNHRSKDCVATVQVHWEEEA